MKTITNKKVVIDFPCPETPSNCHPIVLYLLPANYFIELWGASGSNSSYNGMFNEGGKGGYTSGIIQIKEATQLYVYIGGTGSYKYASGSDGGWNGGGDGTKYGGSGGGATDVRYINEDDSSKSDSLNSRILVAGGGGGSYQGTNCHSSGGNGGGLQGDVTSDYLNCNEGQTNACYGSQESCEGGNNDNNGKGQFGIGGTYSGVYAPGGGGGYWGGGSNIRSSGGGSSYIGGTSTYNIKNGYTESAVHFGNGKFAITYISDALGELNCNKNKPTITQILILIVTQFDLNHSYIVFN